MCFRCEQKLWFDGSVCNINTKYRFADACQTDITTLPRCQQWQCVLVIIWTVHLIICANANSKVCRAVNTCRLTGDPAVPVHHQKQTSKTNERHPRWPAVLSFLYLAFLSHSLSLSLPPVLWCDSQLAVHHSYRRRHQWVRSLHRRTAEPKRTRKRSQEARPYGQMV